VSPSYNGDASDTMGNDGARPLTRKELREQEKALRTESNDVVSEQAYETGHDDPEAMDSHQAVPTGYSGIPASPERAPAPVAAPVAEAVPAPEAAHAPEAGPVIPDAPESAPTIEHVEPLQQEHAAHDDEAWPESHDAHEEYVPHAGYEAHGDHDPHAGYESADGHYYDDAHDGYHPEVHHGSGLIGGAAGATAVPGPSKKVRRRRRLLALFLTLAVFVTAVAVGAQFLKPLLGNDKPSDYPGPGTGEVTVSVTPGEGTGSMAAKLENQKVVANADTFLQAFAASGGVLSPGDYTFKMEMKNADAVNVLLGTDKSKVIYFALSAGLRIGESLQAISEGSGVSLQQLKEFSNSPAQFGLPANAKNLEGFLAPGEYRFPLGTPAKEILQSLVKVTVDELVAQGITDPAKQYEAVIVASIVQAEGGQAEYGDVAGAIYNRLKPNDQTNGYLQVDSAVTYGLGTKSFNFTDEERQDKSNLYNTYANPGLPPGPIGSPGKTAIDAAAKPKTNDYLYWVTINLDTKETKFSRTLAEHNVYVEQYNTWCTANVGRCA
jgi:UPF0755 protein